MKARLLRVVKLLAYPAFYVFCLVFFGYLTFPYGRLKDRVIAEIEKRGKPGQRLEIGKLGSYWITGVAVTGVKLHLPPDDAPAGGFPGAEFMAAPAPAKESVVAIDEAHARVRILPLLLGHVRIDFWASAFGGEISGSAPAGAASGELDLELDHVDLHKVEPIQAFGVPLRGTASGKLTLEAPEGKFNKANGSLDLKLEGVVVSEEKTKIMGLIELPPAKLGEVVLSAEAKDGTLKVTKLADDGADLEIVGDGKVSLREPWSEAIADLFLRFKFSDAYRAKNETTKLILGDPGSTSTPMIEMQMPKMKRAKRPDGFYGWHIAGPLKRLRYEPTTVEFAGASPAGPKRPLKAAEPGFAPKRPPFGSHARGEPAAEGVGRPDAPVHNMPPIPRAVPQTPPEAPPPPPPPPPPPAHDPPPEGAP